MPCAQLTKVRGMRPRQVKGRGPSSHKGGAKPPNEHFVDVCDFFRRG